MKNSRSSLTFASIAYVILILFSLSGCYKDSLTLDGVRYSKKDMVKVKLSFRDYETNDTLHDIYVTVESPSFFGEGSNFISSHRYNGEDSLIIRVTNPKDWLSNDRYIMIKDSDCRYPSPAAVKVDFTQDIKLDYRLRKATHQIFTLKNTSQDTVFARGTSGAYPKRYEDCCTEYQLEDMVFNNWINPNQSLTFTREVLPNDSIRVTFQKKFDVIRRNSFWIGNEARDTILVHYK
jgi:hypothetical protein